MPKRKDGEEPLLPSHLGVTGQNCPEDDQRQDDQRPPRRQYSRPEAPNGEDGDAPYITGR